MDTACVKEQKQEHKREPVALESLEIEFRDIRKKYNMVNKQAVQGTVAAVFCVIGADGTG